MCKLIQTLAITVCFLPAISPAAMVWSNCQTIVAVSDYIAHDSSVLLTLSPGISGCVYGGTTGGVSLTIGQVSVDSTNINGLLATSLTALSTGRAVMIFYDNGSANCYGQIISVGGIYGQC
jgi:hypothetical protein